jgi:hypothetical protein
MRANEFLTEAWSQKYKKSINCSHPKGFSQKAHCAGKKKHNESIEMEMVCPDCGLSEDWNKVNHHDKTNGLSQKAVNAYRREHPGSHLQTAVTTKPSKLKAGSKSAKRRKSFCARMSGNKGPMKKPNGKPTPKALALRRWNCESVEHMVDMIIENMDHAKDNQAVPELKAALLARKDKLQHATDDQVYDIIDGIMTRIAKSHGISGQKLHDMWVDQYDQVPDTWIMKEDNTKNETTGDNVMAPWGASALENFADGKHPEDKGDSKRHHVPTKGSVSSLRKFAKSHDGRAAQLAHWMANMKSGHKK